jgi:hypothetical protein
MELGSYCQHDDFMSRQRAIWEEEEVQIQDQNISKTAPFVKRSGSSLVRARISRSSHCCEGAEQAEQRVGGLA